MWAFPFKHKKGEDLPAEQALCNRLQAGMRAVVEHLFRIIKRQFGYTKVCYRDLFKNGQQLYLLFALGNLYPAQETLRAA